MGASPPPTTFGHGAMGLGAYDVESAINIGLLELLSLHFHNA